MNTLRTYIFDLDGTLADNRHRHFLLPKTDRDKNEVWDVYNMACIDDTLIVANYYVLESLCADNNNRVIILTNRSENARSQTGKWLDKFCVPYHELFMRPNDFNGTDVEFKLQALESLMKTESIIACYDDNPRIVRAIRARGVTCYQVDNDPPCTADSAPSDTNMGLKFDGDKVRMDLLFNGCPNALQDVGKVLTMGAAKYADNSWQQVDRGLDRYLAAMLRHQNAIARGELVDPESKLPHRAHVACNALFLLELEYLNKGN